MSKCSFNFSSLHSINSFKDVYTVPITQEKIQMSHKSSLSTKMPAQTYLKFLKLFHGMKIMQAPFINVNFAPLQDNFFQVHFLSDLQLFAFFFQFIHMKWINIFFVKCPSWCFVLFDLCALRTGGIFIWGLHMCWDWPERALNPSSRREEHGSSSSP